MWHLPRRGLDIICLLGRLFREIGDKKQDLDAYFRNKSKETSDM
jgi:hypothetical protein